MYFEMTRCLMSIIFQFVIAPMSIKKYKTDDRKTILICFLMTTLKQKTPQNKFFDNNGTNC
jgi:hypothetical protein